MSSTRSNEAFMVKFRCGNCGNSWVEYFEPGERVVARVCVGVIVGCGGEYKVVRCPVCGLVEDVAVVERAPLDLDELKVGGTD